MHIVSKLDTSLSIGTFLLAASCLLPSLAHAQALTIGPFLQAPTPDAITVVWEHDVASAPTLRYGIDALDQEFVPDAPALRHEARLTGLVDGATYRYALYDGDTELSEEATFPTALATTDTPFTFVAFGDTRTRPDVHASVVAAIGAVPDVRFALQSGDLVSDGEIDEQWLEYFAIEQPLLSHVPVFPAIGNHDEHNGDADNYVRLFALPEDSGQEEYYSFDYGNVHVVTLDGHTDWVYAWPQCVTEYDLWVDGCLSPQQWEWFVNDLETNAQNPDIDHTILHLHIGPYSSKEGRSGNAFMRYLMPWLHEMGVNLILSGHDHYYERGLSYNDIPYIITGGGGAPLYEVGDPSSAPHTVAYNESVENFVVIEVDGPVLSLTAQTPDGRTLDSFQIVAEPECDVDADCAAIEPHDLCDATEAGTCTAAGRCAFGCQPLEGANPLNPGDDTGADDVGTTDAGPEDIGAEDTGAEDTGAEDSGAEDSGGDSTQQGDTSVDDTNDEDTTEADSGIVTDSSEDGGCECSSTPRQSPLAPIMALGVIVAGLARRRRSDARRAHA